MIKFNAVYAAAICGLHIKMIVVAVDLIFYPDAERGAIAKFTKINALYFQVFYIAQVALGFKYGISFNEVFF